jgi:hypothetical protein
METIELKRRIPNKPQVERNPPSAIVTPSGLKTEVNPVEVIKCPIGINKAAISKAVTIKR